VAQRALVADDDPDIRDLVSWKLSRAGFEVSAAGDGPAALELLRKERFDVALLDVTMPGMSGLDVCRAVRMDPATASVAVIILTASVREPDVEAGFGAGADDYVPKPFSPRELLDRVQAVLARSARSAGDGAPGAKPSVTHEGAPLSLSDPARVPGASTLT